jgi:two-component system sensor histidine kinase HupT/HoxJ
MVLGAPIGELQRAYRELDAAHQRLRQTQQQLLTTEKMPRWASGGGRGA